ncbi:hypothetical protein P7C71_g4675, partial [Lecanoromycetidae sp. Uapishka_2]
MGLSITFLATYILGGVTFLPIILALLLLHAYLTLPKRGSTSGAAGSLESSADSLFDTNDDGRNIKTGASASSFAEKFHRRHEPDVAAGYFAVCREYVPGGINGKPPERTTPAGAVIATESPSVYQSMYRSIFDRKQGPTLDSGKSSGKPIKRARNIFFVVLRHGHLMLYEDSEQMEVKHVISLEHHDISIYGGDETTLIPEGELWIKKNAIRLAQKPSLKDPIFVSKPFFLFSENCSDKEDFYFALLQNQEVRPDAPGNPPRPQQYENQHIIGLVQKLHSSEEHLQTRWINGLIGRLFLALYKTQESEDFIRRKITKKIARVKKPAFLSDIVLRKVDMGESAPHITNPRLKDLTIDGDCCVEADFKYNGNFRLEIAATAKIDLGARFKAREVNLVLAVVIKKLNGHALVKFKPPPSNRVWISFETMPDMEMMIEPIVSSRQITYGIILRAIESRIREVMAETIVLPHWDDMPFTDTTHQDFRGGIWTDQAAKDRLPPEHTKIPDEAPEDEAEAELESPSVLQVPSRRKDEKFALSDIPSPALLQTVATNSTPALIDSARESISTGSQKPTEIPKALRSRSFASAANPLLSMDNANVDSAQTETKRKQKQDATSSMMAISNRSRPTSPNDEDSGFGPEPANTLFQNSKKSSSRSSTASESNDPVNLPVNRDPLMDSRGQLSLPPTPTSTSSRSTMSALGNDTPKPTALQADNRTSTNLEKRQPIAAIGAATAAAKNWGWGVLNRNLNQKQQHEQDSGRAGSPNHPMGRGRPLPPPGQPLPFPEGTRSKPNNPATPKRKPIASPNLAQRRQDETKTRLDVPPPLPKRKRQGSTFTDSPDDEGILIVKAPPDSGSSTPVEERQEELLSSAESEKDDKISSRSADEDISSDKKPPAHTQLDSGTSRNAYEEDENTLSSWQSAQEEEARSKDMWIQPEQHS